MAQLTILKAHYCFGKEIGSKQLFIPPLLDEKLLVQQAFFFKLIILANCHAAMSPPLNCNPYTKNWTNLANNQLFFH
jgi:hypothetical protein